MGVTCPWFVHHEKCGKRECTKAYEGNQFRLYRTLTSREATFLEPKYHKFAVERGAIIKEIIRIERQEDMHFLFEDADFSIATIKQLIQNGEKDAENALAKI